MKVLVTGASGQLGYDVCRELEKRGIWHWGVSSKELDITDQGAVHELLLTYRPDAVIHCAAYTAVDKAEDEPERCWVINADGTRNIAKACQEIGAKMAYISTDYVFPGTGEQLYQTDEPVGPKNIYGKAKLSGELAVQSLLDRYFIVRTSWVFGVNGNNFVKTMLRLAQTQMELNVVYDQIGSPTYTVDIASVLCDIIETEKFGTYHVTNEGVCSWAEFAREIFRLSGKTTIVHPISTREYPTPAARPLNSRLSKAALDCRGFIHLPDWHDALKRYLQELS